MSRRTKAATISGTFVAHTLEMRTSIAWRHLPDDARRILDQLEVEHMEHGGAENGRLVRTYTDFHKGGIRRSSIALAIRQAVALGFLKVTVAGTRSAGVFRAPNFYALTYLNGRRNSHQATDDWRRIVSDDQAHAALQRAAEFKRPETQARSRGARTKAA